MTREEYLTANETHADRFALYREYYAQFVTQQERDRIAQRFTLDSLRQAYAADKYMNGILLATWDALGLPGCRNSMKAQGDFPSLANGVCVWKEAARQALEQVEAGNPPRSWVIS